MRWSDVGFLHWPVRPEALRHLVPRELQIDTYDGRAWVGIVPFRMEGVRLRGVPPIPTAHAFPELNVRTYARARGLAGVWFFSLDAASRLAVRGARLLYNLPYYEAEMDVVPRGEGVDYRSQRVHSGAPAAAFAGTYTPVSGIYTADPGTLEHFLVERYRLFTHSASRGLGFIEVDHDLWPLQKAAATIASNTMTRALGVEVPAVPPLVHFARAIDVLAWTRRPLEPT